MNQSESKQSDSKVNPAKESIDPKLIAALVGAVLINQLPNLQESFGSSARAFRAQERSCGLILRSNKALEKHGDPKRNLDSMSEEGKAVWAELYQELAFNKSELAKIAGMNKEKDKTVAFHVCPKNSEGLSKESTEEIQDHVAANIESYEKSRK